MSDYLQLSILPFDQPWPPEPALYPYRYEQLSETPAWEQRVLASRTMGLSNPAWTVFCRCCLRHLDAGACLVLQSDVLMLFNGAQARVSAQRLSPLPRSVDREIQGLMNRDPSLILAEVRRDVLAIRNAMADWLGTLSVGQVGVARRYDWGKY